MLDGGAEIWGRNLIFHRLPKTQDRTFACSSPSPKSIVSVEKPSVSLYYIYRCTADVDAGTMLLKDLTTVEGHFLQWRDAVIEHREPRGLIIHANTFLEGDQVILKEYPLTKEGLIQSQMDRDL